MKRILCFLIALLHFGVSGFSQDIAYSALLIPDSLKTDASVVKRLENISFEVSSIERANQTVHQVYTVLSEKGKNALTFYEYTHKYRSLSSIEIRVYDALGRQIGRYNKKDLSTTVSGEGLVDDGMIQYISISANEYPVTVEYKYEIKFKGTLVYPSYDILTLGESLQQSSFIAKVPKELGLRFKAKSSNLVPAISEDEKSKTFTWSAKNMPAIKKEVGSAGIFPVVRLAPNRFKYDDYEGDLSSWKTFGQWYGNLYKGLDELPADRQAFFRDLVKQATSEQQKIKLIYEYLQQNFRYVSIQLGIGGLKPFSAEFTDKKKYGDCKALSNFMYASLKAVGIRSYPAVINAGANGEAMDPSFPSKFSNHVILCVPGKKDSTWLECTSNTTDFGVLGNFTENRNALLITENGGVLVATPKSRSLNNRFSAFTTINLKEDGAGETSTAINTSGEFKEMFIHRIFQSKHDEQKQFIVHNLGFRQPDDFSISRKDAADACVTDIRLSIEKLPEFTAGNKMFLSTRLYKLWTEKLPAADNRRNDYYFDFPLQQSDTTVFKLPAGFKLDALPKAKELKCDYASYTTDYKFIEADQSIYSISNLVLAEHKIPADKYAEVKKFFDELSRDEGQRIVVKKN